MENPLYFSSEEERYQRSSNVSDRRPVIVPGWKADLLPARRFVCLFPHTKGVEMLVVSLRGVKFGFWSHIGTVLGKTRSYFAVKVSFWVAREKNIKIYISYVFFICFIYSIRIIQVFDDNVFAIIKSHCIFHLSLF